MPKQQTWRPKAVEACALLARAVSKTGGGEAHTVQLMLVDAAFRRDTIRDALNRAKPLDSDKASTAEYQKLQQAADLLRGYEGRPI